jgi:tetratricopeptide (TPR) repeat protein
VRPGKLVGMTKRDRKKAVAVGTLAAENVAPAVVALTGRQHLLLALVFLLALAVRGAYLWGQYKHSPLFNYPQMDGLVHHQWAQRIATGEGMDNRPYLRAPLYYYWLGGLYWLFGPSVALARIAGCILGAVSCYLIARLGAALGGFRVGLLAGCLAALYWPLIYFDAELLTVGVEVLLNVAMLWALLAAGRRGSWGLFLLGGVLWGLATIARPNVLALAPAIWLWCWLTAPQRGSLGRRLRAPLLATVGCAAMIAPVTIRNYVVGHEAILVASTGGINFFIGNNPASNGYVAATPGARPTWDEWLIDIHRIPESELGRTLTDGQVSAYWSGRAWSWIRSDPAAWMRLMITKLRLFWSPIELPNNQSIGFLVRLAPISAIFWIGFPLIACLAIPGFLFARPRWPAWFLPIAFVLVYMVTVVAFFCPARFRMPVVPILIIAAAAGVVRLAEWAEARRYARAGGFILLSAACAALIATNPPERKAFRTLEEAEGHYLFGRHYATLPPNGPGDFAKAVEEYREAVRVDPENAYRRTALARVLFELNRVSEAGEQFVKAVEAQPNDVWARLYLGQFLATTNNVPAAIEQYQVALKLRPGWTDLQYDLGTLLLKQGQADEARAVFEQLLQHDPVNAMAWQNLGVAQAKLGRLDPAMAAFEKALQLDPKLFESSQNLALALRKTGRQAEAITVLTGAADACAAAGHYDKAAEVIRQALALARSTDSAPAVNQLEARLQAYERQQPYRETPP